MQKEKTVAANKQERFDTEKALDALKVAGLTKIEENPAFTVLKEFDYQGIDDHNLENFDQLMAQILMHYDRKRYEEITQLSNKNTAFLFTRLFAPAYFESLSERYQHNVNEMAEEALRAVYNLHKQDKDATQKTLDRQRNIILLRQATQLLNDRPELATKTLSVLLLPSAKPKLPLEQRLFAIRTLTFVFGAKLEEAISQRRVTGIDYGYAWQYNVDNSEFLEPLKVICREYCQFRVNQEQFNQSMAHYDFKEQWTRSSETTDRTICKITDLMQEHHSMPKAVSNITSLLTKFTIEPTYAGEWARFWHQPLKGQTNYSKECVSLLTAKRHFNQGRGEWVEQTPALQNFQGFIIRNKQHGTNNENYAIAMALQAVLHKAQMEDTNYSPTGEFTARVNYCLAQLFQNRHYPEPDATNSPAQGHGQ